MSTSPSTDTSTVSSTSDTSVSSTSTDSAAISSSLSSALSSSVASVISSSVLSASDSTTTLQPSSTHVVTSIISASSVPPTTHIITSVVTASGATDGASATEPVTVVITSVNTQTTANGGSVSSSQSHSTSSGSTSTPASLPNSNGSTGSGSSSGLSTGGKTAIAVVIPVVVVALLVIGVIFWWRRHKKTKADREARRKEVEDYGFNPNSDPTIPQVASEGPEMSQDTNSGYRGWGAATGSNRKMSTTLSGGHTQQLSDSGGSYGNGPGSPTAGYSDGHSGDPLVMDNRRMTMGSDDIGVMGAGLMSNSQPPRRGPSNASSAYSNRPHSEVSEPEPVPQVPSQSDYNPGAYGYGQHGPYGDGSYGGGPDTGMPVVRDVSARRNTRIQQGGNYHANSGIAQNF